MPSRPKFPWDEIPAHLRVDPLDAVDWDEDVPPPIPGRRLFLDDSLGLVIVGGPDSTAGTSGRGSPPSSGSPR
jgi:hypothetical protein